MNIHNKIELKGALIGMIYGDCSWAKTSLKSSGVDEEYMKLKKSIMENVTPVSWYVQQPNKGHYGTKPVHVIQSRVHPVYERLKMRTTHNGRNAITEYAMKTITPLGLLLWYLDDGCLDDSATHLTFQLHTNSFTEIENQYIQKCLYERFGIRFNVRKAFKKATGKTYYWLYLKACDRLKFFELCIEPYWDIIPDTMKYKCSTKQEIEERMEKMKRYHPQRLD